MPQHRRHPARTRNGTAVAPSTIGGLRGGGLGLVVALGGALVVFTTSLSAEDLGPYAALLPVLVAAARWGEGWLDRLAGQPAQDALLGGRDVFAPPDSLGPAPMYAIPVVVPPADFPRGPGLDAHVRDIAAAMLATGSSAVVMPAGWSAHWAEAADLTGRPANRPRTHNPPPTQPPGR